MALNPLANPKGVKLCCELCAKPAFTLCSRCRVTYYCGMEHQSIDFVGIHEKICQHLVSLRSPIPFSSGSEEDREKLRQLRLQKQKQMITLTRNAGQKLIFEEKYEYAIPALMQALKFSIDVYGKLISGFYAPKVGSAMPLNLHSKVDEIETWCTMEHAWLFSCFQYKKIQLYNNTVSNIPIYIKN